MMATKNTKSRLACVDVGDSGAPGTSASEIICKIYRLSNGRYEAIGSYATGQNQGYFQQNYSYGPWRGRGNIVRQALDTMLSVVPEQYAQDMRLAAQEAEYDAEDAEHTP